MTGISDLSDSNARIEPLQCPRGLNRHDRGIAEQNERRYFNGAHDTMEFRIRRNKNIERIQSSLQTRVGQQLEDLPGPVPLTRA